MLAHIEALNTLKDFASKFYSVNVTKYYVSLQGDYSKELIDLCTMYGIDLTLDENKDFLQGSVNRNGIKIKVAIESE